MFSVDFLINARHSSKENDLSMRLGNDTGFTVELQDILFVTKKIREWDCENQLWIERKWKNIKWRHSSRSQEKSRISRRYSIRISIWSRAVIPIDIQGSNSMFVWKWGGNSFVSIQFSPSVESLRRTKSFALIGTSPLAQLRFESSSFRLSERFEENARLYLWIFQSMWFSNPKCWWSGKCVRSVLMVTREEEKKTFIHKLVGWVSVKASVFRSISVVENTEKNNEDQSERERCWSMSRIAKVQLTAENAVAHGIGRCACRREIFHNFISRDDFLQ